MLPVDFSDLDELAGELRDLGPVQLAGQAQPFSVDVDAQLVTPPGVWISLRQIEAGALGVQTYRLRLYLVASDVDHRDAMSQLQAIANHVGPTINQLGGPTGPIELATLLLNDGAKLPALVVPIDLDTTTGD